MLMGSQRVKSQAWGPHESVRSVVHILWLLAWGLHKSVRSAVHVLWLLALGLHEPVRSSMHVLWLLACCFGGTPNSGSLCISYSLACSQDTFPPIDLPYPGSI